jgi:hypothetical protein
LIIIKINKKKKIFAFPLFLINDHLINFPKPHDEEGQAGLGEEEVNYGGAMATAASRTFCSPGLGLWPTEKLPAGCPDSAARRPASASNCWRLLLRAIGGRNFTIGGILQSAEFYNRRNFWTTKATAETARKHRQCFSSFTNGRDGIDRGWEPTIIDLGLQPFEDCVGRKKPKNY